MLRFQISFKNMKSSPYLQSYAEDKLGHQISKYTTAADIDVLFYSIKKEHTITCSTLINGISVQAEHTCDDMYTSIDKVCDKMSSQLKKIKDKKTHKDHTNIVDHLRVEEDSK